MDGKAVYACTVLAIDAQGKDIETLEGIAQGASPIRWSTRFVNTTRSSAATARRASSMAAKAFLDKNPNPTPGRRSRHGLGGNLCRCGTYVGVRAGRARSRRRRGRRPKCLTISWPPTGKAQGHGQALTRARRSAEVERPGQVLVGPQPAGTCCSRVLLTCPHAHARVTSIDISEAEKMQGRDRGPRHLARRHRDPVGGHRGRRGRRHFGRQSPATRRARSRWSTKCCRTW